MLLFKQQGIGTVPNIIFVSSHHVFALAEWAYIENKLGTHLPLISREWWQKGVFLNVKGLEKCKTIQGLVPGTVGVPFRRSADLAIQPSVSLLNIFCPRPSRLGNLFFILLCSQTLFWTLTDHRMFTGQEKVSDRHYHIMNKQFSATSRYMYLTFFWTFDVSWTSLLIK